MNTNKKITILHLWSSFKGDYELFNQVVMGLDDGYHHIICYMTGEAPEHEALHDAGYDVRWLGYKKRGLRKFSSKVIKDISNIVEENQIDIVHAHRHKPTFYAALVGRKHPHIKILSSVHGLERSRGVIRKITNRVLWPRINKIIAVSQAVKKDILNENSWLTNERVEVVYNGIKVERFRDAGVDKNEARALFSLPKEAWIWGAVGRLAPVKGHEILLKAWADAELGKLGCHLALAGDGDLRESLSALAEELRVSDQVSFLGHVSEVPKFLKAIDGFVMPSLHEGFGLALVEALSSGLPCVATAVGGMPEILSDLHKEGYSYLVEAGDIESLSRAMSNIVSWPSDRREKAEKIAEKHAELFTEKRMLESMNLLYQQI